MKNTEKIPDYILRVVAQNLGHEEEDGDWQDNEQIVKRINVMTKDRIFKSWCEWNGLIGYSSEIKGVVMHIFGFEEGDE